MFLQFFVAGAILPIMSLYLINHLEFSGSQAGIIIGVAAISSIFSPFFAACIADRFLRAEHLLSVCHLLGAVIMFVLTRQTAFFPVLSLYFLYTLITTPTPALVNAITFHHSPRSRNKFGNIRVWGTIGWIAVAWAFSFGWLRGADASAPSRLPDILRFSAFCSIILAIYSLSMPRAKKVVGTTAKRLLPLESLKVIMKPEVLALSLLAMCITFIDKFYVIGTAPFLKQIGFSDQSIMPAMSLGQIPEIFAMGLLSFFLFRFGVRAVMAFGVLLEIFRFTVFSLTSTRWLVYCSISVHGLAYTLIFISSIITLDKYCKVNERTGAHQIFSIITAGVGGFLGGIAAGKVADLVTTAQGVINYTFFWAVPAVVAGAIFIGILAFIKEPPTEQEIEVLAAEVAEAEESIAGTAQSPNG